MSNPLYFILSTLPSLPQIGESPPISVEEGLRHLRDEKNPALDIFAGAIALEEQLMGFIKSRLGKPDPQNVASIPPQDFPAGVREKCEADPVETGEVAWIETIWNSYLVFLSEAGKRMGSPLLSSWARFEHDLREKLAETRIKESRAPSEGDGIGGSSAPKEGFLLRPSARESDSDLEKVVLEWSSARDPMAAEQLLDQARSHFINRLTTRYSFSLDEIVAYFLNLRLLHRYSSLDRESGLKILQEVTAL